MEGPTSRLRHRFGSGDLNADGAGRGAIFECRNGGGGKRETAGCQNAVKQEYLREALIGRGLWQAASLHEHYRPRVVLTSRALWRARPSFVAGPWFHANVRLSIGIGFAFIPP